MRNPSNDLREIETLDDAASLWFARRDAGLTAAGEIEFEQWVARDPRHAAIWREFQDALEVIPGRGDTTIAQAMNRELARRHQRRQRFRLATFATGLLAAAAAVALMFYPSHKGAVTGPEAPPETTATER